MPDTWVATRWGYVPMDRDDEPDMPTRCEGPAFGVEHGCGRFLASGTSMCARCEAEAHEAVQVDRARQRAWEAQQAARDAYVPF